jgi:hypothetical protein
MFQQFEIPLITLTQYRISITSINALKKHKTEKKTLSLLKIKPPQTKCWTYCFKTLTY